MKTKPILLGLCFLFFLSINSYTQEIEELRYDFANFEPLSPEKFIENNFRYLKEYYDENPSSITTGVYSWIIPKGKGFRDRDRKWYILVYGGLIQSAVLEWAQSSGYAISYEPRTSLNDGFGILQSWDDRSLPQLSFTPDIRFTFEDETIETRFTKNDYGYTGEEELNGSRKWLSSNHEIRIFGC